MERRHLFQFKGFVVGAVFLVSVLAGLGSATSPDTRNGGSGLRGPASVAQRPTPAARNFDLRDAWAEAVRGDGTLACVACDAATREVALNLFEGAETFQDMEEDSFLRLSPEPVRQTKSNLLFQACTMGLVKACHQFHARVHRDLSEGAIRAGARLFSKRCQDGSRISCEWYASLQALQSAEVSSVSPNPKKSCELSKTSACRLSAQADTILTESLETN